jgi:hypothetical protein
MSFDIAIAFPESCATRNTAGLTQLTGYSLILRDLSMPSVPLDPHTREPRLAETKSAGGGRRDVNDAAADERSPIDDLEDRGATVVQVENLHSRSKRERFVGRNQPTEM